MGVRFRGSSAALAALFVAGACSFDSAPLAGGPGLEPPGGPAAGEGNTAGLPPTDTDTSTGSLDPSTGVPGAGSGGAGGVPAMDPTVPPFTPLDGGGLPDGGMPDGGASGDAALTDAGGIATCEDWSPPGGECPAGCTSCDSTTGICLIDCIGFPGLCSGTILECPKDWACRVNCSGLTVCNNGGIKCGDGPCEVSCAGLGNCTNWNVECGRDRCAVDCTGIIGSNFVVTQGDSCLLQRTGC